MKLLLQTSHNRWIVVFSSAVMFFCAVLAGVSRQLLDRWSPEFKTQLVPDPPLGYATLGVIALLFLTGMIGNAGLILFPTEQRRGAFSFCLMVLMLLILVVIAEVFGSRLLSILMHFGGGVSGGEGD